MNLLMPGIEAVGSQSKRTASLADEAPTKHFDVAKFVGNFELLATATGGVEGLRAMTLYLAIRGALTGEIRSGDAATSTEGLIAPFNLPARWAWRHVKEVGDIKLGRQRAPNNHTGPHMRPYLRVANVHEARIDISDVMEMNFEPDEAERFLLAPGDVLLNEGQSYELVGRPAIYRGEVPGACFQNTLIRFRPMEGVVLSEYALVVFRAYMRTGRFRQEAQQTTNIAHLSAGRLAVIEFPLPPLAEQKRIVDRVDQLMALIDDLEAKQTKKRDFSTRFTKASLEALTTAESPEAFDTAWQRVVDTWASAIDTPEKVEPLRQCLIWLAVHGRLGTGRPQAEQIPVLRVTEQSSKRLTVRDVSTDPLVIGIPANWLAAELRDVAEIIDPNPSHRYPTYKEGKVPLLSTREFVGRGAWDLSASRIPLVPENVHRAQNERCRFEARDIVFARKGRLGLARFVPDAKAFAFSHTVFVVKAGKLLDSSFLVWFLRVDRVVTWLTREMNDNTGVPTLGKATTERLPCPVPPLPEQQRIVAQIEHLMKLCDDLEAKLRGAEDRASKLVEAVVQEMVA